jgi:hypothetical protein
MDRDEMNNLYRGSYIEASVHLAKQCQRRRLKCEKLAYDGRQAMSVANIAFGEVN